MSKVAKKSKKPMGPHNYAASASEVTNMPPLFIDTT